MSKPVRVDHLGVRHVYEGEGTTVLLVMLPQQQMYPIGMAYVAAALREAGIGYDVLDLSTTATPDWSAVLKAGQYVAVGAGGLFGNYLELARIFADIRNAAPELPLILGGAITWNVDSDVLLDHICADLLVVGEGEITAPEVIRRLASGQRSFDDIPGLIWRDNGVTKRSPRRAPIDLKQKDFLPDWDIVDRKIPFMIVLTGRGCTGTCTFCSPTNGRFRARTVDNIMAELERDLAEYTFSDFVFLTEILFPDAATTLEFCSRYKRLKPHKPFVCLLRCDFPVEVLPDLRAAGCRYLHVGVESGSDRILEAMGKRTTVEMVRQFVTAARKLEGLNVRGSIMFGNYAETAEDIDATVDLACELGIRQNTALVLNYPGTVNYRRARERGLVTTDHDYLVNMAALVGETVYATTTKVNNGPTTYPNISALDTPTLLKKTQEGLRRFHTTAHRAKVIRAAMRGRTRLEVTAACPFCGAETVQTYDTTLHTPLDMAWECPCSDGTQPRPVYIPALDLPVYGPHLQECAERFRSAQRVALLVGGDLRKADAFLWADRIGLDLDKVCAMVATPCLPEGYIENHRILPLDKVRALDPDLYVVPDCLPKSLLRQLYGDSLIWELPEPQLCLSGKIDRFRQHLGADIVHVLPVAVGAIGERKRLERYLSPDGLRLLGFMGGSRLKRGMARTKDRVWETAWRKRLIPQGSRQFTALKQLRNALFSWLPGR